MAVSTTTPKRGSGVSCSAHTGRCTVAFSTGRDAGQGAAAAPVTAYGIGALPAFTVDWAAMALRVPPGLIHIQGVALVAVASRSRCIEDAGWANLRQSLEVRRIRVE